MFREHPVQRINGAYMLIREDDAWKLWVNPCLCPGKTVWVRQSTPENVCRFRMAWNVMAREFGFEETDLFPGENDLIIVPDVPCTRFSFQSSQDRQGLEEFIENMINLYPRVLLPNPKLSDIVFTEDGDPFCLDWKQALIGWVEVKQEYPCKKDYEKFLRDSLMAQLALARKNPQA